MRQLPWNIHSYHIYLLNFIIHAVGIFFYKDMFIPKGGSDPFTSFIISQFGELIPFILIGILAIVTLVTLPYFYLGFLSRTFAVVFVVLGLVALYFIEEPAMLFGTLTIVGAFFEFSQEEPEAFRSANYFWVNEE